MPEGLNAERIPNAAGVATGLKVEVAMGVAMPNKATAPLEGIKTFEKASSNQQEVATPRKKNGSAQLLPMEIGSAAKDIVKGTAEAHKNSPVKREISAPDVADETTTKVSTAEARKSIEKTQVFLYLESLTVKERRLTKYALVKDKSTGQVFLFLAALTPICCARLASDSELSATHANGNNDDDSVLPKRFVLGQSKAELDALARIAAEESRRTLLLWDANLGVVCANTDGSDMEKKLAFNVEIKADGLLRDKEQADRAMAAWMANGTLPVAIKNLGYKSLFDTTSSEGMRFIVLLNRVPETEKFGKAERDVTAAKDAFSPASTPFKVRAQKFPSRNLACAKQEALFIATTARTAANVIVKSADAAEDAFAKTNTSTTEKKRTKAISKSEATCQQATDMPVPKKLRRQLPPTPQQPFPPKSQTLLLQRPPQAQMRNVLSGDPWLSPNEPVILAQAMPNKPHQLPQMLPVYATPIQPPALQPSPATPVLQQLYGTIYYAPQIGNLRQLQRLEPNKGCFYFLAQTSAHASAGTACACHKVDQTQLQTLLKAKLIRELHKGRA
mmetsp:Transcript_12171/g.26275  ORF Transcript_12171/g.26275 Transcript_12171/m.26275 type:complete len:560 (+) Transcript_12171:192-1871(+)